jgi:integrase
MRRRELIGLRVEHVLLDAPTPHGRTVDLIELPAQLSKTRRARDIDANASPLMAKLLRALVKGRAPHESLLGLNYGQLGFRLEGLRRVRGAPKISIKTLRSTCATYQLPLPTDLKRKADRLGHGVAVAARHYQSSPRGLPEQTESLEEAMGCAAELEKVIEACSVRCYA